MGKEKNVNTKMYEVKKKHKNKSYASFGVHIFCNYLLFVFLLGIFIYTSIMSFSVSKEETVRYQEKGNIDYKVYLKENSFYDKPYLDKGMVYVASLIDNINVKFHYDLNMSENSNIDIKYKIIGKLTITSQNNSNIFYEKGYDLTNEISDEIVNKSSYSIDKEISIDYNYYNNLANKFKSNYAVNTDSTLEVYLYIEQKNKEDNRYEFSNQKKETIKIPLSLQEISISLDNDGFNDINQISFKKKVVINDWRYVCISVLLAIFVLIILIKIIKSIVNTEKTSYYDVYVNRLLRGYDRLIVNIKTKPILGDYDVIELDDFQELLDVRENVKEPINYYVIEKHIASIFFVVNNKHLYLYMVKATDLEREVKHEKK